MVELHHINGMRHGLHPIVVAVLLGDLVMHSALLLIALRN